jgi:hypothetical protein
VKFCNAIAIPAVFCVLAVSANADILEVSGTGLWGANAPVTAESAPNESFTFSFNIPEAAGNPSSLGTNFVYMLNGSAVPVSLSTIQFFPGSLGGLFDLDLSNGDTVSAYGADAGSGGTVSTGVFPATFAMFDQGATGAGSVVISDSAAPEPSFYGVVGAALGLLVLVRIRRYRPDSIG